MAADCWLDVDVTFGFVEPRCGVCGACEATDDRSNCFHREKYINSDAVIIKSLQMRLVRCCRCANSWFAQLLIIQLYIHGERRNLQINGLWMAARMLAPGQWEKYLNCESATTIET